MSLYDRLVPAEALSWGTLTRLWDPWADVGPWFVMPYATGGFIPQGQPTTLTQADFPLIRFTDEPIDIAAVVAAWRRCRQDRQEHHHAVSGSLTIRPTRRRRSWLPWRKRR